MREEEARYTAVMIAKRKPELSWMLLDLRVRSVPWIAVLAELLAAAT